MLLRRKPVSSVLRLQRRIKTASLYEFAEFCSNKAIRKEFVFVLCERGITISYLNYDINLTVRLTLLAVIALFRQQKVQ